MNLTIKQYKYEKVEVASKEIQLPTEESYYFETGIRRSIKITPEFTTWNKEENNKDEELYALNVICVYNDFECKLEKFKLMLNEIEEIYYSTNHMYRDFVVGLIDGYFHPRKKEEFDKDFNYLISQL